MRLLAQKSRVRHIECRMESKRIVDCQLLTAEVISHLLDQSEASFFEGLFA